MVSSGSSCRPDVVSSGSGFQPDMKSVADPHPGGRKRDGGQEVNPLEGSRRTDGSHLPKQKIDHVTIVIGPVTRSRART